MFGALAETTTRYVAFRTFSGGFLCLYSFILQYHPKYFLYFTIYVVLYKFLCYIYICKLKRGEVMNDVNLMAYKKMLPEIFHSVTLAIGSQVMLIVLERSLWKTKIKYPEAENIYFTEEGIFLDKLDSLEPEYAEKIVREFVLSIVETLGKLIGLQVAEKLTEKLSEELTEKGVDESWIESHRG